MKKFKVYIIIFSCCTLSSVNFFNIVHWASGSTVTVTEKIPWANCSVNKGTADTPDYRKYDCDVPDWFGWVMLMLKWFIKYAVFLAILWSILMLVISWIRMSVEWNKDWAKKQFGNVIKALLVIFLLWFILNTVAPWVYK